MTIKRPAKARPKSTLTTIGAMAVAASVDSSAEGGAHGHDESERKRLLGDFEKALVENPSLNAEERDTALRRYGDALSQTPVTMGVPALEEIKENFRLAIDGMIESNEMNPGEKEGLLDQMKQALKSVDSDEVKMSYEYSLRLEQDGPEKAAQWLAERTVRSVTADAPSPVPSRPADSARMPPTRRRRI